MSFEANLYKKKLGGEDVYKFKKRCWTCRNYILNRDGTGSCTQYGKLITYITDRDCALDGSQRR